MKFNLAAQLFSGVVLSLALSACSGGFKVAAFDETGDETAKKIDPPDGQSLNLSLNQATNVRTLTGGVLEFVTELPPLSVIQIPTSYEIVNPDYRTPTGTIDRSSTGFVGQVKLVSVPDGTLSQTQLDQFNKSAGGLYVSATVATSIDGIAGLYKALPGAASGVDFVALFQLTGQPRFSFTTSVTKRFGPHLNKPIDPALMSAELRTKYKKIFAELQRAANRKTETPKSYLMINGAQAVKDSIAYEVSRAVAMNGGWSIAVGATAVRHGFDNVPCAEFMSEMVREAYQRAGYPVSADFNVAKGNELIWTRTNAVVNFSQSLYDAGWIPYEPTKFRPPIGALLMNASGNTPGHTFLSAGDDGRLIVDNGSPQGRDLRVTSKKILEMMYETGVFFLPPGITPQAW